MMFTEDIMSKEWTKTVSIRLNHDNYLRLLVRATKHQTTVGQYLKEFIIKDLHRSKANG